MLKNESRKKPHFIICIKRKNFRKKGFGILTSKQTTICVDKKYLLKTF